MKVIKNKLSLEDKEFLEKYFENNSRPNDKEKNEIAHFLKVSYRKIKNWFQNRRAKERLCMTYEKISEHEIEENKVYPQCNSLYLRYFLF
ncbi:homeobox protein hd-9 [Vairimorpha ceranae]|uniref:Homeobox protein hd-9 n=1 Tax=Vairimorpha ceranae TaxID=40302 RepID=A0A0F9YU21_9MICR|nr:homeobox protein hd-9 [Vairimorpha ceranae]KKO75977.1 homeobox protein hd-9 [Vairimorpha ceranae]